MTDTNLAVIKDGCTLTSLCFFQLFGDRGNILGVASCQALPQRPLRFDVAESRFRQLMMLPNQNEAILGCPKTSA